MRKRRTSRALKWIGAIIFGFILTVGFFYIYEMPGGIDDWRHSRAIGLSGTMSLPLGRTPEVAVSKFRDTEMQIVHRESMDGGALLFLKRYNQKEPNTDLQIEFVRKTWLGWKWAMGGGYSAGLSEQGISFTYMSMKKHAYIKNPFPIVFGQIMDQTITSIAVTTGGNDSSTYPAKVIDKERGQRLWYAELPSSVGAPYEIEAYDVAGKFVARASFDDANDFAWVLK